jgi:hypothetical protein
MYLVQLVEGNRISSFDWYRNVWRVRGTRFLVAGESQEEGVQASGVKYVSLPNGSIHSATRRQLKKQRWFKRGQKWRTGREGRTSVLKRRHGLARSRYRGSEGMRALGEARHLRR